VDRREYVAAPAFTPRPYGLLTSLNDVVRTPTAPHWQMGVTWESLCGDASTTYDDCIVVTGSGTGQPVPPSPAKADTGLDLVKRGATAFTVFAEIDCSAPGFWDRAADVVGDGLLRTEQEQVERALWTGVAGGQTAVFPHLAANATVFDESNIQLQTAAVSVSGTATYDVVEGLGRLEAMLASCYGGQGVIHAPTALASSFASMMLVTQQGNKLVTNLGNTVVFGAGYPGTSPSAPLDPSPAASQWMYATGAMFIYRSRATIIPIRSSLDRGENTVKAIAERTYVIGWDCCHFATQVTMGGTVAGSSGTSS
jgi:hypothetical protein